MTTLSDIEMLAQKSRDSAIRAATSLFKAPEKFSTVLIETMIDSIITAAMMEISAMQIKMVEDAKK
ncbi:MAG TPA: hypothetical protein VMV86_07095 [Methanosarcinales archaeon]|nr:hypothetical protein [Methanosarcinales archaeon]